MIRTRIAPSPTGQDIHIGNLYTALINWAYARKHGGQFILRIEDTDQERVIEGAEQKIIHSLEQFGLSPDESPIKNGEYAPYRQSERLSLYKQYAEELVQKGMAYYCTCTKEHLDAVRKQQQAEKKVPKYDRHCLKIKNKISKIKNTQKYVIRLKIPHDTKIVFHDVIRGEITFNSNDLDDQVLLKSDGYPTYHLAVVVDDHLMKISHVIRAEEWISSTPKHVVLYDMFGWERPVFAHLPILRNPDKSKLSKRKNAVWASWYLKQGYFPEALLNYLSLMGWSHPEGKEMFSLDEFVRVFELSDMKAVGPIFDPIKLEWMNGVYIRKLKIKSLKLKIQEFIGANYPEDIVEKTIPLVQERIRKLSDYLPLCDFFFEKPKKYEIDFSSQKKLLEKIHHTLSEIKNWHADLIGEKMLVLAQELAIKNSEFFIILRVAITGKKISPPLNESMQILGKEECLSRVHAVYEKDNKSS
ncbi:MAG TPA: glutamate--tRNA ligase [Patescibacteria group bacterium]|nr:glutamate--tRNA ligase [Patescibacteria group bacterium]